jgi:hypothetical protein
VLSTDGWHLDDERGTVLNRVTDRAQDMVDLLHSDAEAQRAAEAGSEDTAATGAVLGKRRRRQALIAVAAVLILALLAFASYGVMTLVVSDAGPVAGGGDSAGVQQAEGTAARSQEGTGAQEAKDANAAGVDALNTANTATFAIPNLTQLQGMGTDDALLLLGEGWQYTGTEAVEVPEGGSTELIGVAVLRFANSEGASGDGTPTIRCDLFANGNIRTLEFTAQLGWLDYSEIPFAELVSDTGLMRSVLESAGITAQDSELTPPPAGATALHADPANDSSPVVGESWDFTGTKGGAATGWTLTFAYLDVDGSGGSGGSGTDAATPQERTITLKVN